MISVKVLVLLFLSRTAIVMALDPASYLEVTLLLSIQQRLFLLYRLLKRFKTSYPPKLRKRLPFDNNDVFRYQLYGLGETNELQSMDIFCFSKSISFENDIGKYVKNPGEMLATLSFVL